MKNFVLSIVFIFTCVSNLFGNDLIVEWSGQFRQGNAKEISKYFPPTVNLLILNDNNVYSKVEAEIILESFFKTNSPTGSKIIHRLDSNPNFQYAVIELNTIKGYFRVSYSIKINDNQAQIVEIRIEKAIN